MQQQSPSVLLTVRRRLLRAIGLATSSCLLQAAMAQAPASAPNAPAAPAKVLRYAFPAAETSFDPAQISDLYSRLVTTHIFEALYKFDYLARPYLVIPNTAAGMPEVADDFKTWTIRIQPGIYFNDDPAFKGQRRELVAQDYVYAWKRFFDPVTKSPGYSSFKEEGVIGVDALREEALKTKKPFNYDKEIAGLRAIDRYTLQFKLERPRPRFLYSLSDSSLIGAVAREVVESYGDKIGQHPVGTGPFKLGTWRRSSRITLERNPSYREVLYDGHPTPDDAEGQALLQRFKGRRLPMVDRVEVSIIDEGQPRWLSFLNNEFDYVVVPLEFSSLAAPNGKIAPNLAKRGMTLHRKVGSDYTYLFFNMEDPVVGGYTPEKVALRRAISLATDVNREITIVRRGQAIPAQSMVVPGSFGFDPAYKSENSDYSVPRAKALLDMYGYVDRNGDGWRDQPDGKPLVMQYATQPDAISRSFDEIMKKNFDSINVRLQIKPGQWPEQLKAARAGQLMLWQLGSSASTPDAQDSLEALYGPSAGGGNLARFKNPRFDEIYRQMQSLPDGPERLALLREAQAIVTAYAPLKYNVHRIINELTQPWLVGYRRPSFGNQFWQYVDIDESQRKPR
jgi:ABC-type transport system substrate-binding protein